MSNVILMDKNISKYNNLNDTFNGSWSYNIEDIFRLENKVETVIKLIVPNREMLGIGEGDSLQPSIDNAIDDAFSKMFIMDSLSSTMVVNCDTHREQEIVTEFLGVPKEEPKTIPYETATIPLNSVESKIEAPINPDEFVSFDEVPNEDLPVRVDEEKERQLALEKEKRDNATPIPGSDITQIQIDFMNEFKEHNQIDTDDKFDYYVKTWATHNSIDEISTKKQLIGAGKNVLESFIVWIKKFQPILDEGIVSPL